MCSTAPITEREVLRKLEKHNVSLGCNYDGIRKDNLFVSDQNK